ncbi:MAG: hypothetical protein RBQ77_03760 [Candidatus Methanomethylophilaceae archaeon]|jgi:hypothetical protein|nr:hypothetical protein [Candidatus Methanomethylophilaceae archaeon]
MGSGDGGAEDVRMAPLRLYAVGPLAFAFATYYFVRIFDHFQYAFDYGRMSTAMAVFFFMMLLFALYANYVLNLFRMMTGDRRAWGVMMRLSLMYLVLLAAQAAGVGIIRADVFSVGPAAMAAMMLLLMLVMLTRPVRRFFTPAYAEEATITRWLRQLVWVDPFECRMTEMPVDGGPGEDG